MEQKGYKIIVIGDKKHDEVQGIIGQLKNRTLVIDNPEYLPLKAIQRTKKACVVLQSTQDSEKVIKIVNALSPYINELKFFNTICKPTRIKQEEIKTMSLENEVMIIIGSKTSANTRRLYEIAKSLNRRSYWIESKEEIKPQWLKGAKKVGISAGASTPDSTTNEIVDYIKQGRP
jgi:4-hydroxy-3-methylbut-2-enyl diphosphate reductase